MTDHIDLSDPTIERAYLDQLYAHVEEFVAAGETCPIPRKLSDYLAQDFKPCSAIETDIFANIVWVTWQIREKLKLHDDTIALELPDAAAEFSELMANGGSGITLDAQRGAVVIASTLAASDLRKIDDARRALQGTMLSLVKSFFSLRKLRGAEIAERAKAMHGAIEDAIRSIEDPVLPTEVQTDTPLAPSDDVVEVAASSYPSGSAVDSVSRWHPEETQRQATAPLFGPGAH